MSTVIRISERIYKRLEKLAVGFNTPDMVIERLLDYYDEHAKRQLTPNSTVSNALNLTKNKKWVSKTPRKRRDLKKEQELREAVGKTLNWGSFQNISQSVLHFPGLSRKVICKYSSYSPEQNRWFWGVSRNYWLNRDENLYLALIMENTDLQSYSFLLLGSDETSKLLPNCSISGNDIKINLRFYMSDGKLHIQEWQEYDVEGNIKNIAMYLDTQGET